MSVVVVVGLVVVILMVIVVVIVIFMAVVMMVVMVVVMVVVIVRVIMVVRAMAIVVVVVIIIEVVFIIAVVFVDVVLATVVTGLDPCSRLVQVRLAELPNPLTPVRFGTNMKGSSCWPEVLGGRLVAVTVKTPGTALAQIQRDLKSRSDHHRSLRFSKCKACSCLLRLLFGFPGPRERPFFVVTAAGGANPHSLSVEPVKVLTVL
jgi:hypothetical protein